MDWMNPANTPFIAKLTAKTSSGGVWLYSWEEYRGQSGYDARVAAYPGRQGSSTINAARELNNLEVDVDCLVVMWCRGAINGQMAYEFDAFGADGVFAGVTVAEVDGSPSYSAVTTLTLDQADGFVVTEPVAGTVRIDIQAASATQAGVVSTTTQTFAGVKTFQDDVTIEDNLVVENNVTVNDNLSVDNFSLFKDFVSFGPSFSNPVAISYASTFYDAFGFTCYESDGLTIWGSFNLSLSGSDIYFSIGEASASGDVAYRVLNSGGTHVGDTGTHAGLEFTGGILTGGAFNGATGGGSATGTNTGDQNIFQTIAVSGQSNVVADTTTDTLTLAAGSGITITTDASTDTVTIAASGGQNSFQTIAVSGQSDVVADSTTDTLTLVAGTGMTITTNASTDTITISGPVGNSSGSVSLVGTSALSDTNGTWSGTIISVSLPAAGTYELWSDVRGQVEMSAGSDAYISSRLYDGTFVVGDSETLAVHTGHLDIVQQATGSCRVTYTAASAVTIALQVKRDGATTWTVSNVLSDSNGRTRMGYTRIS